MSSCVSATPKQDELVVKTGFELRLRKVDFSKMRGCIPVIGTTVEPLVGFTSYVKRNNQNFIYCSLHKSILDVPKPERGGAAAIICYNEPTYNGMQSLYHMFGERLGLTSYDMFKQVVQKCQKNGEAIVFTKEELMWCPSPEAMAAEPVPERSDSDRIMHEDDIPDHVIRSLENIDPRIFLTIYNPNKLSIVLTRDLPTQIQDWIRKYYRYDTSCGAVYFEVDKEEGGDVIKYKNAKLWGFKNLPSGTCSFDKNDADWRATLFSENMTREINRCRDECEAEVAANKKKNAAKAAAPVPAPVPKPEEPSIQAQLTALTAAVTALTKLVETALTPKA